MNFEINQDKCPFFTSFAPKEPNEYNYKCINSWKQYTNQIILIQSKKESKILKNYYPELKIVNSTIPPQSYQWSKPHCPNIMDFINFTKYSDIIIINSDIYLDYSLKEWSEKWKLEDNKSFICGVRTHYEESKFFYFESFGIDIFKIPRGTFKYFEGINTEYLIGVPGWDYWLFLKLIDIGFSYKVEKFNLNILHEAHELNWNKEDLAYAMSIFDKNLYKTDQDTKATIPKIIQEKTGREGWSLYNAYEKTLDFIDCTNWSHESTIPLMRVYCPYGVLSNLIYKNIINIQKQFGANYINGKVYTNNYLDPNDSYKQYLLLGNNKQTINSIDCQNLFFIRHPNDILVSRYVDFVQNENKKIPFNLNKELYYEKINKYKMLDVDEFVLIESANLKNELENYFKIINDNKNSSYLIIQYEEVINNKEKICDIIFNFLKQIRYTKQNVTKYDIYNLWDWPSKDFYKDSLTPGFHKKLLKSDTIDKLNYIFEDINKNFKNLT
jgi:hypothetical protein